MSSQIARCDAQDKEIVEALKDRISTLERERDEAYRRRDEWKKKADGYDAVRLALREKVGSPWPPSLSQTLWAGIAADEKKRADDARCEALEEAAKEIECDCPGRDTIASLPPNSGERWRLCLERNCRAIWAAAIRALKDKENAP